MKTIKSIILIALAVSCFAACQDKENPEGGKGKGISMSLTDRLGYKTTKYESSTGSFSYTTGKIKLHTGLHPDSNDNLPTVKVNFPEDHSRYRAAYLTYTMCSTDEGPAAWDQTTMVVIKDKKTGEWYELARAFTPYGGKTGSSSDGFNANWSKSYYMDVTELLPIMEGETEIGVYYCGWESEDASRHHAVQLGFNFYEGTPKKNVIFTKKVYDSSINSTPGYRRCWPYGFEDYEGGKYSLEAKDRLGERTINIPAGVKSALLRVDITGHGMDYDGEFPDRKNKEPNSCAEFDEQNYTVRLNGKALSEQGRVFERNNSNYEQWGTYYYDRAGWGPGKPANVHYWEIKNIPAEGAAITLDIDFERYVTSSGFTPNSNSNPYYIIEADLFGFDK